MKIVDNKKYRRIIILISIPILIILQYYFFKVGILRPMVRGVELNIEKGDYVADIDQFVMKLNDEVTLSSGEYIYIPSYSKKPNIWFNVLDDSGVLKVVEEDKLIAMKEGISTVGIMKNSRVLRKANVKVVDPKVQKILVNMDAKLKYVGDSAHINSIIEVDYDKFKEKEKATYKSSDENIIKITDNKIEAVGVGKATVYAKAQDKEDILEFNIKAKIDKINIENNIEISEGQEIKLNPDIITVPAGLKHPKVKYEFAERKLDVQRAISLSNNGTIQGIREGEDEVNITCDGKSKKITIKVVKEPLTNSNIKNVVVDSEVIDGKLQISIEWDYIEGILDYEVHLRNNSLKEKKFKVVKSIHADKEAVQSRRVKATINVDLIDGKSPDISLKVLGKTKFGITNPSNIINIKPPKDDIEEDIQGLEVKNLKYSIIDKENNIVKLDWDNINIENAQYSIYIKNNLSEDGGFILLHSAIELNEYTMNLEEGEIDVNIYVKANQGEKYSKDSNQVRIVIEDIDEDEDEDEETNGDTNGNS